MILIILSITDSRKISITYLKHFNLFIIYLFINYNTITNYIPIIYELSNFDHMLGVVSQTTDSGGTRTNNLHTNNLAHYALDYQDTLKSR